MDLLFVSLLGCTLLVLTGLALHFLSYPRTCNPSVSILKQCSDAKDWCLITGASSGLGWCLCGVRFFLSQTTHQLWIGEKFAEAFARRGFSVVLVARRVDKLREVGRFLELTYSVETQVIAADLSSEEVWTCLNLPQRLNTAFSRIGRNSMPFSCPSVYIEVYHSLLIPYLMHIYPSLCFSSLEMAHHQPLILFDCFLCPLLSVRYLKNLFAAIQGLHVVLNSVKDLRIGVIVNNAGFGKNNWPVTKMFGLLALPGLLRVSFHSFLLFHLSLSLSRARSLWLSLPYYNFFRFLDLQSLFSLVSCLTIVLGDFSHIEGYAGWFHDQDASRLMNMIHLNCRAPTFLMSAFLADMLKRQRGIVVNVSSVSAYQPLPSVCLPHLLLPKFCDTTCRYYFNTFLSSLTVFSMQFTRPRNHFCLRSQLHSGENY